jgi:hypothetical protein
MAAALETLRPRPPARLLPKAIERMLGFFLEPKEDFLRLIAIFLSAFIAALTFLMQAFLRTAMDLYTRLDPTFLVALILYFRQMRISLAGGLALLDFLEPLRLTLRRVLRFFPKLRTDNILILLSDIYFFQIIKIKLN